ncbi:type II secretion system protein GspM [Comamonas serinivorans]|nr:type II secretion system protein GspM [Comamonas serinivorans]
MNWRKPLRTPREGQARKLPAWLQKGVDWHAALAPRERTLVWAAALVVALAVCWWGLLSPALSTLQRVAAERQNLDAQWQQMMSLQHEAQALQAQPKLSPQAARQALEASVTAGFGDAAKLQWTGDRANITVTQVSGGAVAQWVARARVDAKAVPVQVRLTRAPGAAVLWNGLISVGMPQP